MKKQTLIWGFAALVTSLFVFTSAKQGNDVVSWTFSTTCLSPGKVKVTAKGVIEKGWHIYDVVPMENEFGSFPTKFILRDTVHLALEGNTTSPTKVHESFDEALGMEARYYEGEVVVEQVFKVMGQTDSLRFAVEYQACDDKQCIFPWPKTQALLIPSDCKK